MNKIWFPAQRAIRTAVQIIITLAGVLATIAFVAPQILEAVADVLPGPVVTWLLAFIATITAISMALSRVMAIPAVDDFFKKFGAGTAPAGATSYTPLNGEPIPMTRRQWQKFIDTLPEDTE